jgi:hypothetical protein
VQGSCLPGDWGPADLPMFGEPLSSFPPSPAWAPTLSAATSGGTIHPTARRGLGGGPNPTVAVGAHIVLLSSAVVDIDTLASGSRHDGDSQSLVPSPTRSPVNACRFGTLRVPRNLCSVLASNWSNVHVLIPRGGPIASGGSL